MNMTQEYMALCSKIVEWFDKYGFPENFEESDKSQHLTINWDNRYVIDVRPYVEMKK